MFSMLVQVSNVQRGNGRVQDLGHGSTHGGRNLGFHGQFQNNKLQFKSSWKERVGIGNLATAQESLGNCVENPVNLCDFQLFQNRIMKTIHSVYQVDNHGYSAFISVLKAKSWCSVSGMQLLHLTELTILNFTYQGTRVKANW